MQLDPLLPDSLALRCEDMFVSPNLIVICVSGCQHTVRCPDCGQNSERIHSRYRRTLADLPLYGVPVVLRMKVRRFFCENRHCPRQIFTERLPQVTAVRGRKTGRLVQTLTGIAMACGGEGGARLGARLGMVASPDTLLRCIRKTAQPLGWTPEVLGVDDWAIRRGQRYGTILCDLKRHRPIDLLPDRSADVLRDWLSQHPGVEIVSRDRGELYANGATAGAPKARQVADRWHLTHNMQEALARAADRHHRDIRQAVQTIDLPAIEQPTTTATSPPSTSPPPAEPCPTSPATTKADEVKQLRRANKLARYQQVVALHQQGVSMRDIARTLGIYRGTVRRFLSTNGFPERAERRTPRQTDTVVDHLRRRWDEGCHNAATLTKELKSLGFKGSYHMIRRRVGPWREQSVDNPTTAPTRTKPIRVPSATQVSWFLMHADDELEPQELTILHAIQVKCPELKAARGLAHDFTHMLRNLQPDALDLWIDRAHEPGVAAEMRTFADGLKRDYDAVKAALTLEWSNGQVEGQINRLKLVKRQMYGRANFDLLRLRFLNTG